ncbi:unnamed protein product [Rotaria magnacalcarata]|uniref:Uncharacterized protein n=2 Tax=Rotaria magnacalcarata TaxID=392030 RepID=A0A818XTB6_9BILA|nr:unnamed protein product [Rotaria magnacalcarata]CAF3743473.1 unnamed protein product [Rotaria magnacalcarata]
MVKRLRLKIKFSRRFIVPESTKLRNGLCPPYDATDCFEFTLGQGQPNHYIPCSAEEKTNTSSNSTIVCYWWIWKNYDAIDYIERIGVCFSVLYVLKYYLKLILVVNLFANERHKGIAAGIFVKLASIVGLHPSIMRHQQDSSIFKHPYLRFAIAMFNISICILVIVLLIIGGHEIIDISITSRLLLFDLIMLPSIGAAIANAVNWNDWVALLKGPRNISPTTISISDNNRTEELQFETDVALTRKTRRKRSRQVTPGSEQNGTCSPSHTKIPLEQLEQRL